MPTPLSEHETRLREHGRIRIGQQVPDPKRPGKMKPVSIDNFRFTSPDKRAIEQLAALYGGEVKAWKEPKASPPDQWEVFSPVSTIDVWIGENSLSQWYELHGGGGLERRCDGVTCTVPFEVEFGNIEYRDGPCICNRVSREECRIVTRINVIIPGITFGGQWRLETKGWNASKELPGVVAMIEMIQGNNTKIITAKLTVERRNKIVKGKRKNFVVPGIYPDATPYDLMMGKAGISRLQLGAGGEVKTAGEIGPGENPMGEPIVTEEVADVIEVDDLPTLVDELTFKQSGLGASQDLLRALVRTIKPGASELNELDDVQYDRLHSVVRAVLDDKATIKLKPNGTVEVNKK